MVHNDNERTGQIESTVWCPALLPTSNACVYYLSHDRWGSHEGGLALLQVVTFGPRSRLAAQAHDEAALVDEVAGDVHGQQEEHERHHEDPGPQHDAHGERRLVVHVCRTEAVRGNGAQRPELPNELRKTGTTHLLPPPSAPAANLPPCCHLSTRR